MKQTFLASALIVLAGSAWGEDLMQVYQAAVANDAQLAAARYQLQAGLEKLPQARAGLLPNVSASASTTWIDSDISQPIDIARRYNSNGYQLQLTQPVFYWQNWVQYKQGQLQVGLAEAQYKQAQQDLVLRAAQAYFDILYAQDSLQAVGALKRAASEQLELARQSFQVGTVTITDVHEAQSRFDLAQAQEIAAQNDLAVKREALRVLIGQVPAALAPLNAAAQITRPQPDEIQSWVDAAEGNNLSVQVQQLNYSISEKEVDRIKAGHLPTVDLVANHSYSHSASSSLGSGSQSRTNSVGLQLNIPLYQGGGVSSRVREAASLKEKNREDLNNAKRNAALSARQAYLGVTSGIAQIKGYETALTSSQSALESNRLGYEVGVRINIDVLNAQTQLADTQQKLAKARYDTLISQLKLKSAAGALSEEDIRALNALLSPVGN